MMHIAKFTLENVHNAADLTLCTSPQLAEDMKSLNIKNVNVWRKGINTDIFSPKYRDDKMRRILTDDNIDQPLLIYVGRIGKEKKLYRLKKLLQEIPNCRLAIIGSGPEEANLKKLFNGLPVIFTGSYHDEQLSKAFSSADIFVMPSDSETLGFVVLEAMASGLPVVSVSAGGLPDLINNEITGYLVDNNDDMIDFTNSVKTLIRDLKNSQEMGKEARKYAESWSWEAATSSLRNIHYKQAIINHKLKNSQNDYSSLYRPDLAM